MTVIDTSAAVDYLLGTGVCERVAEVLIESPSPSAPDVMVFEVFSVLRRHAQRGTTTPDRARAALDDLGEMSVAWFSSMLLRERAWSLRENLAPGDALFAALAAELDEPLVTKDAAMAAAASRHAGVGVQLLA